MNLRQRLQISLQYLLPQHGLSRLIGKLADLQIAWFKNLMIRWFMKRYRIDLSAALIENPNDYPSFNDFFIRKLKPNLRPIAKDPFEIASPVDGTLSQNGSITHHQLMQAKGFYYDLMTLLGDDENLSHYFEDGLFSTFYLAPHNYHRVHMPLSGRLIKTIFVPGHLFSVDANSTETIPQLYTLNERLICLFDTQVGQMAVILVGALIVGSINTVWREHPYRTTQIVKENVFNNTVEIAKGAELGYFKMGSTVIVLFPKNSIDWSKVPHTEVLMGEAIGRII